MTARTMIERTWIHVCMIVFLGVAVYSNTFHVPFHFDDHRFIEDNPVIADLDYFIPAWLRGGVASGTADLHGIGNRWVGYYSFAINHRLHGLDVTGYHVLNLAIHIAAALSVYLLILLTLKTPFMTALRPVPEQHSAGRHVALFASLLFAVHPVQTQAVTYIYQRFASLSTLFYLAAVIFYVKARLAAQPARIFLCCLGCALAGVLAINTKETAYTLPVMIVLYELLFFRQTRKKMAVLLGTVLTLLIVGAIAAAVMDAPVNAYLNRLDAATRLQTDLPRWDYFITQFRVIITYLRLLLLPVAQNLDYDYPVYHSLFDAQPFFSLLLITALWGAAFFFLWVSNRTPGGGEASKASWTGAGSRLIAFGVFWFFIALSVESSFIPIVDVINEHRLYLASPGFFIAATAAVFMAVDRYSSGQPYALKAAVIALAFAVTVYAGTAYARNTVWQDEITLWNDNVRKSAEKSRVYVGRGNAYDKRGESDKALADYNQAVLLDPKNIEAYNNRAICNEHLGLFNKAIVDLGMAIELSSETGNRGTYFLYINRGLQFFKLGNNDAAIVDFTKALTLNPGYAKAFNNRAYVYFKKGEYNLALKDVDRAIALDSNFGEAFDTRGQIQVSLKRRDLAFLDFQMACQMGLPHSCAALNSLQEEERVR